MREGRPRCGGQRRDRSSRSGKSETAKIEAKAKLDAAIKEFDRAVELDPAMLEARLNLGEVYLSLNDPEKAELHFLET